MTNEKLSSSIPKLIMAATLIVMFGGFMGTVGYLITTKDDLKNISTETEQTKNISIYNISFEEIFLKDSELKDFYKPYREINTASGIGKGHPIIFGDLTQDGIDEAVVPVSSGGTAGDTAYAVFSVQNNKLTKLFYNLNTYQVILKIEDGQLIEQTPIFTENDANCCPSFHRYTYYKYNKENNKMEIAKTILKKNDNNLTANEFKNEVVDCKEVSEFKNEDWFSELQKLYTDEFIIKKNKIEADGIIEIGDKEQGCLVDNNFVFIPFYQEWGCGFIMNYNIKDNVLYIPELKIEIKDNHYFTGCATKITSINKDYAEFEGWTGNGGCFSDDYGKYYFNDNTMDIYMGCSRCDMGKDICSELCRDGEGKCYDLEN